MGRQLKLWPAIQGFLLALALMGSTVQAAVPHLVRYQGQAVDNAGVPLQGPYTLTFRLYDADTVGNIVWQEQQANVPLNKGHFSVLLGQVTTLNVDWSQPLWLSIQVGTDPELLPRQRITSVPLAIRAEVAESLVTSAIPSGAIILWVSGSCPTGYTRLTTLDGKFLASGATFNANAGGQDSVTVGTSTAGSHSHSISGTTSNESDGRYLIANAGGPADRICGGDGTCPTTRVPHTHSAGSLAAATAGDHSHSVSFDNRPAFATVLLCQKD